MKKAIVLLCGMVAAFTLTGCSSLGTYPTGGRMGKNKAFSQWDEDDFGNGIQTDAYGLGVHADQYGRPVKVVPAYKHQHGIHGPVEIQTDAYGPGIHSDQYGRPVRVVPAY